MCIYCYVVWILKIKYLSIYLNRSYCGNKEELLRVMLVGLGRMLKFEESEVVRGIWNTITINMSVCRIVISYQILTPSYLQLERLNVTMFTNLANYHGTFSGKNAEVTFECLCSAL